MFNLFPLCKTRRDSEPAGEAANSAEDKENAKVGHFFRICFIVLLDLLASTKTRGDLGVQLRAMRGRLCEPDGPHRAQEDVRA